MIDSKFSSFKGPGMKMFSMRLASSATHGCGKCSLYWLTYKSKTCSHDAGGMGWVAVKKQKMRVAAADLSVTHALDRYVHV